jgi:integrase
MQSVFCLLMQYSRRTQDITDSRWVRRRWRISYRCAIVIITRVIPYTPHDLRRTFVSNSSDAVVDIATVAKMAGHSDIQTTARYDRGPEEAKQRAARLLYIPYSDAKFIRKKWGF